MRPAAIPVVVIVLAFALGAVVPSCPCGGRAGGPLCACVEGSGVSLRDGDPLPLRGATSCAHCSGRSATEESGSDELQIAANGAGRTCRCTVSTDLTAVAVRNQVSAITAHDSRDASPGTTLEALVLALTPHAKSPSDSAHGPPFARALRTNVLLL